MRSFIKHSMIFFVPFFFILFAVDLFLCDKLKDRLNSADELSVWTDIFSGKLNCEIAVYGSSRAWNHIDPSIISEKLNLSTYNFGIDGHNFYLQYFRHLLAFQNGVCPKIIIHSIDVFTFEKREKLYNKNQFIPYMLWDFKFFEYTRSYKGFQFADYFMPLIRFRQLLTTRNLSSSSHSVARSNGFCGLEGGWTGEYEKAKQMIGNYTVSFNEETLILYEKFLDECAAKKIKVVLVYTPEYIEGQSFVLNRHEVISKIREYSIKYNLIFLDYSNTFISKDKYCFYNVSHLNVDGAAIFTSVLADDLKVALKLK
jgi:hypothetical protein